MTIHISFSRALGTGARVFVIAGLFTAIGGCSSHSGGTMAASGPGFGNAGTGLGAKPGSKGSGGSGQVPRVNSDGSLYGSCTSPGATRECCETGTQVCTGQGEFASWAACVAGKTVLHCDPNCALDEFGHCKDGGPGWDSGTHCGAGEFGPNCDGGVPPPPSLCKDKTINNEPEILAAYSPAAGESVSRNGQIKVWITDEAPAIIAANEQIDPSNGAITAPGDRTGKNKDGYLWEPALYIAPATAENGGRPYFPRYILGWYNNVPPAAGTKPPKGAGTSGAPIETPPAGARLSEKFNTEDIWEVSDLGLPPGTYEGEFVITDGDTDRAIGCVTITIE